MVITTMTNMMTTMATMATMVTTTIQFTSYQLTTLLKYIINTCFDRNYKDNKCTSNI